MVNAIERKIKLFLFKAVLDKKEAFFGTKTLRGVVVGFENASARYPKRDQKIIGVVLCNALQKQS